jgi:hypothetical protein
VADGVHALVKPMKTPTLPRPLHGPMGVAESPQLPNRNHTMLLMGQTRQFMTPP